MSVCNRERLVPTASAITSRVRSVLPARIQSRRPGPATLVAMALVGWAIGHHWSAGAVLGLIQLYALVAVPTTSIVSTIGATSG